MVDMNSLLLLFIAKESSSDKEGGKGGGRGGGGAKYDYKYATRSFQLPIASAGYFLFASNNLLGIRDHIASCSLFCTLCVWWMLARYLSVVSLAQCRSTRRCIDVSEASPSLFCGHLKSAYIIRARSKHPFIFRVHRRTGLLHSKHAATRS